jgi:hypothetical protein
VFWGYLGGSQAVFRGCFWGCSQGRKRPPDVVVGPTSHMAPKPTMPMMTSAAPDSAAAGSHGLTLVHFSAQPQPFLSLRSTEIHRNPLTTLITSL